MVRFIRRSLPSLLAVCCLGSVARGAWEDARPPAPSGGSPVPSPQPYVPPTSYRPPSYRLEPAQVVTMPSAQGGHIQIDLYSQFLDAPVTPAYRLSLMYVGESEIEGYGSTSMIEADADWKLLYFPWVVGGSIDIAFRFRSTFFMDDPGISLPSVAGVAALDLGWTWRFDNGYALQTRVLPGIYSDFAAIGGNSFSFPFQVVLMRTLTPNATLLIGAEGRPDWDLPVMPMLGIAWETMEILRVEAMVPRTRVMAYTGSWLTLFGTAEWRNITYALAEDEGTPDAFTMNDLMASAGMLFRITDQLHLGAEYGTFAQRTISADVAVDEDLDLAGGPFFRFTLAGPF